MTAAIPSAQPASLTNRLLRESSRSGDRVSTGERGDHEQHGRQDEHRCLAIFCRWTKLAHHPGRMNLTAEARGGPDSAKAHLLTP
jgi:hypothetical protein